MTLKIVAKLIVVATILYTIFYSLSAWITDLRFPIPLFEALSWDEYQYLPTLQKYYDHITNHNLLGFLGQYEPFAYGSIFWQVYAAFTFPFASLRTSDSSFLLLQLRLTTLAIQILCIFVLLFIQKSLSFQNLHINLIGTFAILLPASGLLILAKPFSPDYLATLFFLLSLLLLSSAFNHKYNSRFEKICFALGWFLFGLSVGTKIFNIILFPALFILSLFILLPRKLLDLSKIFISSSIFFLIGLISSNSSILFAAEDSIYSKPILNASRYSDRIPGSLKALLPAIKYLYDHFPFSKGIVEYLGNAAHLTYVMGQPDYQHAINSTNFLEKAFFWWSNENSLFGVNTGGISKEFVLFPTFTILVVISIIYFYTLLKSRTYIYPNIFPNSSNPEPSVFQKMVLNLSLFLIAAFLIFLVPLMLSRVWTWYLIPVYFLFASGTGCLIEVLYSNTNNEIIGVGGHFFKKLLILFRYFLVVILVINCIILINFGIQKKVDFLVSRNSMDISRLQRIYQKCILPNKRYIDSVPDNQVLKSYHFPISTLMREDVCWGNSDPFTCINSATKIVLDHNNLSRDQISRIESRGFSTYACEEGAFIFTRDADSRIRSLRQVK